MSHRKCKEPCSRSWRGTLMIGALCAWACIMCRRRLVACRHVPTVMARDWKFCPFRLALAPRIFMKCMDAVLSLLRLQGVCVLNYLDDWLVLAQSQTQACSHRDLVLNHLSSLGLRTNPQKSVLIPCQRITFLGIDLDSHTMRAQLSPPRVQSLKSCLRNFKAGRTVTASLCLRLLGLVAAASPVIRLGLLNMHPFQWWTKSQNISPVVINIERFQWHGGVFWR